MNPKATVVAGACLIILTYAHGIYQYCSGWSEGRANLVSQQQQEAQAELAKKTQRQQQDESKAAAADNEGKTKSEVITREVVKYINRPNKVSGKFDADRVRIKYDAISNANGIPGYDYTK